MTMTMRFNLCFDIIFQCFIFCTLYIVLMRFFWFYFRATLFYNSSFSCWNRNK